jgi:hypothetical protein
LCKVIREQPGLEGPRSWRKEKCREVSLTF